MWGASVSASERRHGADPRGRKANPRPWAGLGKSPIGSHRRWGKVLKRSLPRSLVQMQVHRSTLSMHGRPSVRPSVATAPIRVVAEPILDPG